jgi:hypothetical protein
MNQSQNQGLKIFENAGLGLAISDKKIIPQKTEWTEHLVYSGRVVPRNRNCRNAVPKHFLEEKNAWNSEQWNKKRSKPSEFRSKLFRSREKCLEFCTVEQK